MNTLRILLAPMMLAVMAGCSTVPEANAPPAELSISQSWSGDYPVTELKLLPEGQQQSGAGYLGSAAAFASVWAAFSPGEAVPTVNFSKQVVVFHRNVNFYNRTRIFSITLKEGVAEVLATETMSAIPHHGQGGDGAGRDSARRREGHPGRHGAHPCALGIAECRNGARPCRPDRTKV